MTDPLVQGTASWFAMVGAEIRAAATQVGLPGDLRISVVERYVDGVELEGGLQQGLRIDVMDGVLAFRSGVSPGETADVVIDVTAGTARQLNLLFSDDPGYEQAVAEAVACGAMTVSGDLGALGPVFAFVHDRIVAQTR